MAQAPKTNGPEMICLGDEVTLTDAKRGIVHFIGPMESKISPIFYGVELKSGTGKNDGTVNGEKYFHVLVLAVMLKLMTNPEE